jgi:sterol desaturase/sphingolipid hydroxylase (fatty acid hydroxylase superfamily)
MLMEINILDNLFELFSSNKRLYWVYILSSILIAYMYLLLNKRDKNIILNKKLWLNKSAILDYKYFIISFFIKTIILLPIIISSKNITITIYEFLLNNFGFISISMFSYIQITILYTISIFIINDFTRYITHRLFHTIPFLWEFHKVHHSAKVLTPLTFYRVHPIENIIFAFRYSVSIGFVTGCFIYMFGSKISIIEIIGCSIFLFIFSIIGSNLRHSHIKISYPKVLEYIFISPFQHQLHHSTKYYNKNFGSYLAIWDTIFNTIKISKNIKISKESIKFGIYKKDFLNIYNILFKPFFKIKRKLI